MKNKIIQALNSLRIFPETNTRFSTKFPYIIPNNPTPKLSSIFFSKLSEI